MVTKVESFSGTTEPNKNYAMGIGKMILYFILLCFIYI
jgi:hypothetical protein